MKDDKKQNPISELRQIANKLAKGDVTRPPFTHSQNWRGKLSKRIRKVASEVVLFDAAINLIRQHTEISEDARLGVCDNCGRLISYENDTGWYHVEVLDGFEYSGECGKPEIVGSRAAGQKRKKAKSE